MRRVTYSMGISLDGYIVGPDGGFDWGAPEEEVFRFSIDEIRGVGVHLMGRRLYETMLYWENPEQNASLGEPELEWAALWNPLPKVVFSRTLSQVQGNARLATGGLAEEIERLRSEPGEGDIAIGGATLAVQAAALGLIDEYRARVFPVLLGGGISFSPRTRSGWTSNSSRPAPSARPSSSCTTVWCVSRDLGCSVVVTKERLSGRRPPTASRLPSPRTTAVWSTSPSREARSPTPSACSTSRP